MCVPRERSYSLPKGQAPQIANGPQRGKPQSANALDSELGPGQTGQPENATTVVVGPKHAQVP